MYIYCLKSIVFERFDFYGKYHFSRNCLLEENRQKNWYYVNKFRRQKLIYGDVCFYSNYQTSHGIFRKVLSFKVKRKTNHLDRIDLNSIHQLTRMTTSISSEAFKKKNRKLQNVRQYSGQKNHKWKNGQSELLSRCLVIINY